MSTGRVITFIIAARSGHVVYERFYDTFKDAEKAEIRSSIEDVAQPRDAPDNSELVGRFKNGTILVIPSGELFFSALGTGEYNALALGMVLRAMIDALKDATKSTSLSDTVLFQQYAQTILTADEICKEGILEHLDKQAIQRAIQLKLPAYGAEVADKGKTLKSLYSKTTTMAVQPKAK